MDYSRITCPRVPVHAMMELLRELGPFHYMMNQGNVGDALIAASTVALFERERLDFSSCGQDLPAGKEEITLVYGGGGGFVPYFGMLPHYVRLFSDPRLRKCVILPQSFRDCDELVKVLDERFIVFCRNGPVMTTACHGMEKRGSCWRMTWPWPQSLRCCRNGPSGCLFWRWRNGRGANA